MDSNSLFSPEFFFRLALFGAALVIVGVILEAAELIVKFGHKQKHRKWVGEVFGKSYRRRITSLVKFIHPRILPFEAVGFGLLFAGLAIELAGSFEAERLQSMENLGLQKKVEVLRAANDKLEEAAKDRIISNVQSNLFILLVKDLPKIPIKVIVGIEDYETDRYARQIHQLLDAAVYGGNQEDIIRLPGGLVLDSPTAFGQFSTNALAFIVHGPHNGIFIYTGNRTNDPAMNAMQKLDKVKDAFSQIGLNGIYTADETLVKPGEVGIIVPLKKH